MLNLWRVRKPLDLEGQIMSLESRLTKLETVQQAPRRQYSDAELAIRIDYCLEQGGPLADKVRALLEKVPGGDHDNT